ncbi:C39 family peptidase [Aurantiacibacter suaedae]|uniref:C39 family peptidase n=1 Tax=Aurantiacibacter suaedae TaxID=2545755 RepID=UPI0010F6316C|nr:C39 family peptidase [Aurantiacibacter suaedae]
MQDVRFNGVIRQKFDFSCGSAALATLLRHHYGFNVREEVAFRGMWASGDREQIRRVGFSLLDMKRWLATRGLSADGYEVTLEQVAETAIPGIALINVGDYRHFVVVKGVSEHEVLLGDPSSGLTVMPRDQFLESWNGIYFALASEQEQARRSFDADRQWAAFARAPVGGTLSDPVSQQALMLTAPFFGDM